MARKEMENQYCTVSKKAQPTTTVAESAVVVFAHFGSYYKMVTNCTSAGVISTSM